MILNYCLNGSLAWTNSVLTLTILGLLEESDITIGHTDTDCKHYDIFQRNGSSLF